MPNRLRIILDTNVLLVSISSKSKYHWLFLKLINKEFDLYVSNDIITEYEEIISLKFNSETARNVVKVLHSLTNVYPVSISFKWNLIPQDEDDNKFVDCAIASNAHFIVTNDQHFKVLKTVEFPIVPVISLNDFKILIEKLQ